MLAQAAVVLGVTGICVLLFSVSVSMHKASIIENNFRVLGEITENIRDSFFALDTSLKIAAGAYKEKSNSSGSGANKAASPVWPESLTNLFAQMEPAPTLL